MKKNPKVLLIIPAYNEEKNILTVYKNICDYNKKAKTKLDVVFINDGSIDATEKILCENNINHIKLIQNLGIGGAVQTGYKYALYNDYDIAIQFDGDGQHQAKYLKNLVKEIEDGNANIVIGSRFVTEKKPFTARMLGSRIIAFFTKITTGKTIKDTTSGMRAYDRNAIKEFVTNTSLTPEPDTMVYMLKKGLKIKEVQVEMKEREFGKSYLTPIKSMKYMVNMIFSIVFIRAITRKK